MNQSDSQMKRLYRSRDNRMVAGVAGGIGEYANVDPTLVRIGFVLLTLASGGAGLLVYIAMLIILPEEPLADRPAGLAELEQPLTTSDLPAESAPRRDEVQ